MKFKLGAAELELLQFFVTSPNSTGREACDHFLATRNWQRSTVLKTIKRLMEKGALTRSERGGVYVYQSSSPKNELHNELVNEFISTSLNGSLFPLISYFDGKADITKEELNALKSLVKRLEAKGGE